MAHNMEKTMKEGLYQPKEAAKNMKAKAEQVADDAMEKVDEVAPALSERLWDAVSDIRAQVSDFAGNGGQYVSRAESMIKKYPFATVLGAAAVGGLLVGFFRRPGSRSSQEI